MAQYAMLTNEPERLRRAYADTGVAVTPFHTAVDALVWERHQRKVGTVVLDSRGWQYGVEFNLDENR